VAIYIEAFHMLDLVLEKKYLEKTENFLASCSEEISKHVLET
jgi:hypothetical protein